MDKEQIADAMHTANISIIALDAMLIRDGYNDTAKSVLAELQALLQHVAEMVSGGEVTPYEGEVEVPVATQLLRKLSVAVDALEASPTSPGLRARVVDMLYCYELTGDHNHGSGPLRPGAFCDGGDCWVHKARTLLNGGR